MKLQESQVRELLVACGDEAGSRCNAQFLHKKLHRIHKNPELAKPSGREMSALYAKVRTLLEDNGRIFIQTESPPEDGSKFRDEEVVKAADEEKQSVIAEVVKVVEEVSAVVEESLPEEPVVVPPPRKRGRPKGSGKKVAAEAAQVATKIKKKAAGSSKEKLGRPPIKTKGKMSDLDAAEAVLKESRGAMRILEISQEIEKRGLWATTAKTPMHLTLKGHLYHDIKHNSRTRFILKGKGLFALSKEGRK